MISLRAPFSQNREAEIRFMLAGESGELAKLTGTALKKARLENAIYSGHNTRRPLPTTRACEKRNLNQHLAIDTAVACANQRRYASCNLSRRSRKFFAQARNAA